MAASAAALVSRVIAPRSAQAQSAFLGGMGFPYDAFDALPKTTLSPTAKARINVAFAPGEIVLPRQRILDWIENAARAVTTYYGRYPVASARLLIVPVDGAGLRGGTTWGYRGGAIRMLLGRDSTIDHLTRDWMMTHEMVHLALPDLDQRYGWLSEGLAVYIEPIARVQAGLLKAPDIWQDMARDMPKGQPGPRDGGLDALDGWGRKYWGGALFCLRADVDIRRRTDNRFGLQDAMRGVLAAGGNHEVEWPIRKVLTVADAAVGTSVMADLYESMHATPVTTDLTTLWRELGVEGGGARLRDDAPLAAIREAITRTRPG